MGFDSNVFKNQNLHSFKSKVVYESKIPLSIASIVLNVQSDKELQTVFERLVNEKTCNSAILAKIAELGKPCGLVYNKPPGVIDKVKAFFLK